MKNALAESLSEGDSDPAPPVPLRSRPRWVAMVGVVAAVAVRLSATVLLAGLANLALDLSLGRGLGDSAWENPFGDRWDLFRLGTAVLWLVVILVYAAVGNLLVTTALVAVGTAAAALANYEKLRFRAEPFYPSDLRFAGDPAFLTSQVGGRTLVLFVAGAGVVAGLCVGGILLARRWRRRRPRAALLGRRASIVLRLATALACVVSLVYLHGFNRRGNLAREAFDSGGATWSEWNQPVNYSLNGFVGGFLYNMPVPAMSAPAGYSRAEMSRLVARYTAMADQINRTRDPHGLDDVNVVSVLSEAFSDPTGLSGVTVSEDPIPFTRRLMRTTTSGKMLAKDFGGGTSNMEFEVLTGMSMSELAPQLSSAYQSLVPHYRSFPSAVGWFHDHGHDTVAVHPFKPSMYRRSEVYPILGFRQFVDETGMHEKHYIDNNSLIDDQSAFDEAVRQIEDHRKPVLLNLVTIQNHMPYYDRYDDPVRVKGPTGHHNSGMGQYVRGLEHSDDAMRSFITKLSASNEKTVVVFYGDHLSAAYPQTLFDRNSLRAMHETPFFVWSNFTPPGQRGRGPERRIEEPTTSPWYFMPLAFRQAGAAIPPYYALLEELHRLVPAMDGGVFVDSSDSTRTLKELSPQAREVLHDYRMVQYDLSVGKRYSLDRLFYAPASTASASR